MSLHHLAKHIAAHGRGEDSILIHMTPKEVAGLQSLAVANGGSLTINPHTGLPEAGFLSAILPMIAGAAATVLTGGAAAPVLSGLAGAGAGAVTKGATTGDWSAGSLLGGALSGFGGAGIGNALGAAGGAGAAGAAEAAGAVTPGMTAADLGLDAINQQAVAAGLSSGAAGAAGTGAAGAMLPGAAIDIGSNVVPQSLGAMGQGAGNVLTNAGAAEKFLGDVGLKNAGAAVMGGAMAYEPKPYEKPADEPITYKRTKYHLGDINTSDPSKPYFGTQGFDPYEEYTLAEGGEVPKSKVSDYLSKLNTTLTSAPPPIQARQAAPTPPASTTPSIDTTAVAPSFNPANFMNLGGYNGIGAFFRPGMATGNVKYDAANGRFTYAGGGGVASLGAYSDGGRLLRGPGDGVSDDIPAVINRDDGSSQEARLADGEFVVDAQTVSRLGNGSTEAGARKLYAMMDRIHAIKTKPGKNLNAEKYLPA